MEDQQQMIGFFEKAIAIQTDIKEHAERRIEEYQNAISQIEQQILMEQVDSGDMKIVDGTINESGR